MAKRSADKKPLGKNATKGAPKRAKATAASTRRSAPKSASPRGEARPARSADGPRAPRSAGPRSAGPRSAGPRGAGARSGGPRSAGARSAGPRRDDRERPPRSPRSAAPRAAAPRRAGTPGVIRRKGEERPEAAPVKLLKRGEGAQERPPRAAASRPRSASPRSTSPRSFGDRPARSPRSFGDRPARSGGPRGGGGSTRSAGSRGPSQDGGRPQRRTAAPRGEGTGLVKRGERPAAPERPASDAPRKKLTLGLPSEGADAPRPVRASRPSADRPARDRSSRPARERTARPTRERGPRTVAERPSGRKTMIKRKRDTEPAEVQERDVMTAAIPNEMRLNRFIAASGVTSRRKADELITQGKVKVNGKTVLEMGVQVNPHQDQIVVNGEVVSIPTRQMYLVMNKPKDYITTAKDEKDRKTVFDLLSTFERVYNVGRLDRNTTGVLLFTNDGELTNRLTHPSYEIAREYHATLDKPLANQDAKRIAEGGMDIGDGDITGAAHVAVADRDPKDVILTITEGKNREVRRIFETLGYDVEKLDRLSFGGITHKGMARGEVRPLTRQEVRHLKKLVGMDEEI